MDNKFHNSIANKVLTELRDSEEDIRQEMFDASRYTMDGIMDEIGYNASFSGNEGCPSELELCYQWIGVLFDNLRVLQNKVNSFNKYKKDEEVVIGM